MTIRAGEINKQFVYDAVIDLSVLPYTVFTLIFHHPTDNTKDFTATSPDVTAPAVPLVTPELGTLEANTYLSYQTTGVDFVDDVGEEVDWTVCGFAEDGGTNKRIGPESKVTILAGCS